MPDSTLGIQVQIRTEADVAAVEKATGSIDKLDQVTKELGDNMSALRAKLDAAETALKGTGEAGTQAGAKLGEGMKSGAGMASLALGEITGMADINDLIRGAWDIGTKIGSTIGEALTLASQDRLTWDNLFGDGAALEESAMERRHALQGVRDEYKLLVDELNKPVQDQVSARLTEIAGIAKSAREELAELQRLIGTINKGEDAQAAEDLARRKEEIDASGMSEPEKIRARAAAENDADAASTATKAERRQEQIEIAGREADAAAQRAAQTAALAAEAERRKQTAEGITGGDQYQRAIAGGANDLYLKNMFDRRAREAGFTDLDTPEKESAKAESARAAAKKAAEEAAAAARKERGMIERGDFETEQDRAGLANRSARRASEADTAARKSEGDAAAKELDAASGKMKEAASSEDKSTKQLATTLDKLAALIGTKDKAMSAALEQMAQSLSDGASQQEIAKIQNAVNTIAKFQNSTAQDLSAIASGLIDTIQSQAQTLSQTRKEVEALKQKVNSMK